MKTTNKFMTLAAVSTLALTIGLSSAAHAQTLGTTTTNTLNNVTSSVGNKLDTTTNSVQNKVDNLSNRATTLKNNTINSAQTRLKQGEAKLDNVVTSAAMKGETVKGKALDKVDQIGAEDAGLSSIISPAAGNSSVIHAGVEKSAAVGDKATVDLTGEKLVEFEVDQDKAAAMGVTSAHTEVQTNVPISASAAKDIVDDSVNLDGVEKASSVTVENGVVKLSAAKTSNAVSADAQTNLSGSADTRPLKSKITETKNSAVSAAEGKVAEVQQKKSETVQTAQNKKNDTVSTINEKKTETISTVQDKKADTIATVNETKTDTVEKIRNAEGELVATVNETKTETTGAVEEKKGFIAGLRDKFFGDPEEEQQISASADAQLDAEASKSGSSVNVNADKQATVDVN